MDVMEVKLARGFYLKCMYECMYAYIYYIHVCMYTICVLVISEAGRGGWILCG